MPSLCLPLCSFSLVHIATFLYFICFLSCLIFNTLLSMFLACNNDLFHVVVSLNYSNVNVSCVSDRSQLSDTVRSRALRPTATVLPVLVAAILAVPAVLLLLYKVVNPGTYNILIHMLAFLNTGGLNYFLNPAIMNT